MSEKTHIIIEVVMAVLIVVLSLLLFRSCGSETEPSIETKIDTFYIRKTDTLLVEKPKWKDRIVLDTIYIPSDTILIKEQKVYEDTLSTIWVSGINPLVDSIRYYIPRDTVIINKETTITKTKLKRNGWAITVGPYIGYGGFYNQQNNTLGFGPSVGLSVSVGYSYIFK